MTTTIKPEKPLGGKAYGSIPHLPGSRLGPGDHHCHEGQFNICCVKARDRHDAVTVQEKLDGSNVAVAKINGEIVPLTRSGYRAITSKYEQHHSFHHWTIWNLSRFDELLNEGERIVGEWLMQAHGTRYQLPHEPFVAFDIMHGLNRIMVCELNERVKPFGFKTPRIIHFGGAISIVDVVSRLEPSGHGAIDPVEGAVWRVERCGKVDFLAKFVRHDKKDGTYLPEISNEPAIYNWMP